MAKYTSSISCRFCRISLANSIVYDLDEVIILETINVRKQYKVKLPDAVIAATALVNNLTLLTRNLSDFKKVTGLDVIDPYLI